MNFSLTRFRLRALASAALTVVVQAAWAVTPFTVKDIRVEGLQRVEPGTVFASIPVRIGDTYNDEKGALAIRSLFGLGVFKDVRIEVTGDVVVVVVEERPTVAAVEFANAREFDNDTLKKALREVGLTDGRPYDKALIDRAEQELRRLYVNKSVYNVDVVTTITPIERNRVNVSFEFIEGAPARIKEVRIVGNQAFSESTLKGLFDQNAGNWLSWYTKSDRYTREKLNGDLETLRSYYMDRGYIDFRVDSTQVALSPDKESISITVNITEGERFVVSGVKLKGDFLDRENEFKSLVTIKPGQPFSGTDVADTAKAFRDYYGRFGYAFAKADIQPELDRKTNQVELTVMGTPGQRAYVRRINISGNNRTRDEVIRREFRQFESSWYDSERIRLSRDRVDRLGYFGGVMAELQEVPDAPDQVDVNVVVLEKPTGSIQAGVGYSSSEKASFSFGFKQDNAFGSGNNFSAEFNTSSLNRTLAFSTTDPYFTQDGISRTIDVYQRSMRPATSNLNNLQSGVYDLVTQGAGIKFGVPFTEYDTVYFGIAAERFKIKEGANIPAAYLDFAQKNGYSTWAIPITVGWQRDNRDSGLTPTKGRLQRLNLEAGFLGQQRYIKGTYQYQQFVPLNNKFTLAFNGEIGLAKGLSGRDFPVFRNFYGGGMGSVRGFEQNSFGVRDATGAYLGGTKKLNFNVEAITPFPGAGNDKTLRVYSFFDIGNVYGDGEKISFQSMRASVGVGLSWLSPMGPLRFSYAVPVRRQTGDKIQRFQFNIGAAF